MRFVFAATLRSDAEFEPTRIPPLVIHDPSFLSMAGKLRHAARRHVLCGSSC